TDRIVIRPVRTPSSKRFTTGLSGTPIVKALMTETTAPTKHKVKLYDRLKEATKHRLAEPILALMCFLEAMIIPIFPEIMLAPMIVADRYRAWRLATICTIASVTGGLAG